MNVFEEKNRISESELEEHLAYNRLRHTPLLNIVLRRKSKIYYSFFSTFIIISD